MEAPIPLILVSGGFDPLHDGHMEYLQKAAQYGPVVVALNSDAWLLRKKRYTFMPSWEARASVLQGVKGVVKVYAVDDSDDTVCEALKVLKPTHFAKGGDRTKANTPEVKLCEELGIEMIFGLGEKIRASSDLIKRKWGTYEVLLEDKAFKVKRLVVEPMSATSKQRHEHRSETWVYPDGQVKIVPAGAWHCLSNSSTLPLEVIEIQTGTYFGEDDIERIP